MKTMNTGAKFYVATTLSHLLDTHEGDTTWWCVARDSKRHDLGFVYLKGSGIKVVFEFMEVREDEAFCKGFEMTTGTVKILTILETPVTFQTLQRHPELSKSVAIRRKFQARWFDIEPENLEVLQQFIQSTSK